MKLDISANSMFMRQISDLSRQKMMEWIRSNELDPDEVFRMIVDTETDTAEVVVYDLRDGERYLKSNTVAKIKKTVPIKETGKLLSAIIG